MLRWDETDGSVSVFRQPAMNTNGHTVDREGRLVSCEHRGRCISRTEHDGSATVLADRFDGKRFNSPNDVVVKSDGSIWFTDPSYGIDSDYEGDAAPSEIGARNVYRIDPASGARHRRRRATSCSPTGWRSRPTSRCCTSSTPASRTSADGPHHVRRFKVAANGAVARRRRGLRHLPGRPVRRPARRRARQPVAVGRRRRALPCAATARCSARSGCPRRWPTSASAAPKLNRLFICGTTSLYSVYLNARAAHGDELRSTPSSSAQALARAVVPKRPLGRFGMVISARQPLRRRAQRRQLAARGEHALDVVARVVDQHQDRALGPLRVARDHRIEHRAVLRQRLARPVGLERRHLEADAQQRRRAPCSSAPSCGCGWRAAGPGGSADRGVT